MHDDAPRDAFWTLVAAYIDASDFDELRQGCEPSLFEKVAQHVESCPVCQQRRRAVVAMSSGEQKSQDDET